MKATTMIQTQELARRRAVLLLLALNLFLIGIIGAFVVRYYSGEPAPHRKTGPAHRIETMSALLSQQDAITLRLEFTKKSEAVERATDALRQAREKVRLALRIDPYSLAATQAAMTEAGALHQQLEQLMQDVIATAAAKMTPEGRERLADWPPRAGASAAKTPAPFPAYNWIHWRSPGSKR